MLHSCFWSAQYFLLQKDIEMIISFLFAQIQFGIIDVLRCFVAYDSYMGVPLHVNYIQTILERVVQ